MLTIALHAENVEACPVNSQKVHTMLTRAEALEIALIATAKLNNENSENDDDFQEEFEIVLCEEKTIERTFVFAFFCNTKEFLETGSYRDELFGIGSIIVSKRTGAVVICGSNPPYPTYIDYYEQKAAAGEW